MARAYKWTVEFTIDPVWIADGFELTAEKAHEMIQEALPFAAPHELRVRVIVAPAPADILREQGHTLGTPGPTIDVKPYRG